MSAQPTHWADIQQKTFTRWCNQYLKERGLHIENMEKDFCDGIKLVALIEVISGKSLGRVNKHPRVPAQKLENVSMALQFVQKEGIKLVNIGPEDFVDGRIKLILGFIWTLILRYQIQMGDSGDDELLKWIQSKIPEYGITGYQKDWNDGRAICGLVDALKRGTIPNHKDLNSGNGQQNCDKGISTAESALGVAPLIHADEMSNPKVDKHAMMTYLSQFRNLKAQPVDNSAANAARCSAFGHGLEEGIVNQESGFKIENPSRQGKIEVKVEGPATTARAVVKDNGDGTYDVSYTPTVPGEWKIHVTLNGHHIPGSIFTVTVLEEESLGGEGKFRVFFSTTASKDKGRSDVFNLQSLLEAKKIHLRPDFEPWIPVDIMERDDREAVFRKAGTRALPIVIIDDVVVGDYDAIVELNESGTLQKILDFGIAGAGREFLRTKTVFGTGAQAVSSGAAPKAAAAPKTAAPKTAAPKTATPAPAPGPKPAAPKAAAPAGGAKFCPSCGTPRGAGNFCANCGGKF